MNLRKHRNLIVGCFLIVMLAGSLFGLYLHYHNNQSGNYVTYQLDEANSCIWRDGHIESTTLVGTLGPLPTLKIKKSEEKAFLQQAADSHKCVFRLGSTNSTN